jgi:hypothetical protein
MPIMEVLGSSCGKAAALQCASVHIVAGLWTT